MTADFKRAVADNLEELGKANKLSSLEKPKDVYIKTVPFSVENDLLTPTFKLKRNKAKDFYKTQIDAMYAELHKKGF